MRRVISLYLPTLPTDLVRKDPQLFLPPNLPLVTASKEGNKHIVITADNKAEALGVRAGQTVAHARILVKGLQVLSTDPARDEDGLKRIALSCLKKFTPIVAHTPPDNIWLDITGCAHLFGSEGALLQKIIETIRPLTENVRAAIADTFGAAYALARYGEPQFTILACDHQKAALAGLPIAALRVKEGVAAGLQKLGFDTIGQLYGTPRAPLVRRFGPEIMFRLDQALGSFPEPIQPLEAPEIPQVTKAFAEPVANPDYLKQAIEKLCEDLCRKLAEGNKGIRQLDCIISRVDNHIDGVRVGTSKASSDPRHIFKLLSEHLEKLNAGFGVETLTLRVPLFEPLSKKQLSSFGKNDDADLSSLIDILRNRLGTEHLFKFKPIESDVPERSIQKVSPDTIVETMKNAKALPRPCRLLTPPEAVQALALLPDNPPKHFVWRDKRYLITCADGPERIFGEWWRNAAETSAVRDYFRVEDESGARYWLYRSGDGLDPATGSHKWFIHGVFG